MSFFNAIPEEAHSHFGAFSWSFYKSSYHRNELS